MASVMCKQTAILVLFTLYFSKAVADNKLETNDETATASKVGCDENGDCALSEINCDKICGCDRSGYAAIYYNKTTKSCVVSFKHLMFAQLNIYGKEKYRDNSEDTEDTMADKIRSEADKIFNTIFIAVILFITCCVICAISACLYCCRITYSDNKLKSDVKALAKKLKRDHKIKKSSIKKPREPTQESCNVVCEEAGVYVV